MNGWKNNDGSEIWRVLHAAVIDALVIGALMLAILCMVKWLRV